MHGGYYTQDDIREVVAFAAVRHIMIVPQVDIPGHCSAAMTAYPELAPENGWAPIIATQQKATGERCGAMCVGKENTITCCKDVIDDLLPLFPSSYIHIGGDEVFYEQWQPCPISQDAMKQFGCKDMADLQIHFTNDMVAFVESRGHVLYQHIYPLLFAYSEKGWTLQKQKDWSSFSRRVTVQQSRFDGMNVPSRAPEKK